MEIKDFQRSCQNFWIAGASYAMKKLPVSHELLDNMWPDLGKPALLPAYVIRAIDRFRRLSNFCRFSF